MLLSSHEEGEGLQDLGGNREMWGEIREPSLELVRNLALKARHSLTPNEQRFWKESHTRWPGVRFRRYHDIPLKPTGIGAILSKAPSVWYAPFYHAKSKTIIVVDDRPDFPYIIYGQNAKLYVQQGYKVVDYSEDLSCPFDQSIWEVMMVMIDVAIRQQPQRKAA